MEDEMNVYEVKYLIRKYLNLNYTIEQLKLAKEQVAPYFYASRSMTGTAVIDRECVHDYQSSVNPEWGALDIIAEEQAIQKQIDSLSKRKRLLDKTGVKYKPGYLFNLNSSCELHPDEKAFAEVISKLETDIRTKKYREMQENNHYEETGEQKRLEEIERENILDHIEEMMNF